MKRVPDFDRADDGFTFVELVVAMTILTLVMCGFFLMFAFGKAASNSQQVTQSQASTRVVMRQLESDLRSADPLLQWPATGVPASIAGSGAANTDKIAMYLPIDPLSPCPRPTTTTTSGPPSPFTSSGSGSYTANVVWVYDPATQFLAADSTSASCGGSLTWQTGPELHLGCPPPTTALACTLPKVVNGASAMFTTTSAGTQASISGATANQAAATCASAITISVMAKSKQESTPFKINVTLPLPNQSAVKGFACS